MKKVVLIVDDEVNNITLLSNILSDYYTIRVAKNGEKALKRACIDPKPDLILLDVMMPDMDGYEVCRKLKANKDTAKIPVIFVTAKVEIEDEVKGFEVGAVDYIIKPFSPIIVRKRVETQLILGHEKAKCEEKVIEKTRELNITQHAAVFMLGKAGHYNDTDTGVHIWRMAAYSRLLAEKAGWPVEKADLLELAATLHDTGKIGIPDEILKAPRKLTADEWVKMKKHTSIGYGILVKSKTELFEMAAEIALFHHEKWNGTGYPNGLSGNDIPEAARIVAVADVFDALTMKRPYKEAWDVESAFSEIEKGKGIHFDPDLADIFIAQKQEILRIKDKFDNREYEWE